ncbi:MAG: DnaB-like helicase C-terminal domain-containing protein, partial [Nostoc sp.]|uniref:DnaB-like helicase C-terminal domain-containing protein n=1 Tax=Nostoc sp. TaxID=1180 RepID=UPI002FF76030
LIVLITSSLFVVLILMVYLLFECFCQKWMLPVDSRSEKRPTKADFRESGGFEQEAAVMLGLYREDYYDKQTTQKGIFEVSVLKSRFSSETTVNLLFDERFGQFKNLAKSQY